VKYCQDEIDRIPPLTTVMTFQEWLSSTSYTQKVKRKMQWLHDAQYCVAPDHPHAKLGFLKKERYDRFKHARGIAGCSLHEKIFTGATVKSCERAAYHFWRAYVLKGIPTDCRARELLKRLPPGCQLLGLDFSSFEASVTRDLAIGVECYFFRHLVGDLRPDVCNYLYDCAMNPKVIKYRQWKLKVKATRCSGDMFTSLCNTVINLLLVRFVCKKYGYDPVGVVEGDDGLFAMTGPVPTVDDFAKLGFTAKCELFPSVNLAGFCKMKFDESGVQVTDVVERLVKFGWTASKTTCPRTLWGLLWTKALSLKAEFPGCPVLAPFADWVIGECLKSGYRLNRIYDENRGWIRYELENSTVNFRAKAVISQRTRVFVQEVYNISPEEQLSLESSFVGPIHRLTHRVLTSRLKRDWEENWGRYVQEVRWQKI